MVRLSREFAGNRERRLLRALFTSSTVRVYQAFSDSIAERAIAAQAMVPPFDRNRMTWIKPSFGWMMYRSGWGTKLNQERVLAIDVRRESFESLLASSCATSFEAARHKTLEGWHRFLSSTDVLVQWDPDRDIALRRLPRRTIQVGLRGSTLARYADQWIVSISDMTKLAHKIRALVESGRADEAASVAPVEQTYPLDAALATRIGADLED